MSRSIMNLWLSSIRREVDEFAERFFKALNNDEDLNALTYPSIKQWPSAQTCVLLDKFLSSPMIDANAKTHIALKKLDTLFDFISSRNCEIKFRWLMIGLKAEVSSRLCQTFLGNSSISRETFPVGGNKHGEWGPRQRDDIRPYCPCLVATRMINGKGSWIWILFSNTRNCCMFWMWHTPHLKFALLLIY